jgi:hypothetical protein
MTHPTEEQLILYYYGEAADPDAARHLDDCAECRDLYGSLQRVLNVLDGVPVPEPPQDYSAQVWQAIAHRLPARRGFRLPAHPWRWALAGAAIAALVIAAFLAGRLYPRSPKPVPALAKSDPQANERVLLVAVGDYLDRSQMVLIELANARPSGPLDISTEQERASDLVSESRLYRQTAAHTGDTAVANALDEVDRVLLDIAHEPSELSPAGLERLRKRFDAEGILFKVRVLGSNVRQEESGQKL